MSQLSKHCCINVLYKPLENLDAIALQSISLLCEAGGRCLDIPSRLHIFESPQQLSSHSFPSQLEPESNPLRSSRVFHRSEVRRSDMPSDGVLLRKGDDRGSSSTRGEAGTNAFWVGSGDGECIVRYCIQECI